MEVHHDGRVGLLGAKSTIQVTVALFFLKLKPRVQVLLRHQMILDAEKEKRMLRVDKVQVFNESFRSPVVNKVISYGCSISLE